MLDTNKGGRALVSCYERALCPPEWLMLLTGEMTDMRDGLLCGRFPAAVCREVSGLHMAAEVESCLVFAAPPPPFPTAYGVAAPPRQTDRLSDVVQGAIKYSAGHASPILLWLLGVRSGLV